MGLLGGKSALVTGGGVGIAVRPGWQLKARTSSSPAGARPNSTRPAT